MATFFTADTHFGHGACRALYRRPFPDTEAMDRAMVEGWNARVGAGDTVWHLGDFAVGHRAPGAILDALNGTKHLVPGNNDPPGVCALPGWASVEGLREIAADPVEGSGETAGRRLVLCHYALRSWNGQGKGALNLHGHSHGRLKPMPRQFDVGVDVRGFRPVTVAELLP